MASPWGLRAQRVQRRLWRLLRRLWPGQKEVWERLERLLLARLAMAGPRLRVLAAFPEFLERARLASRWLPGPKADAKPKCRAKARRYEILRLKQCAGLKAPALH